MDTVADKLREARALVEKGWCQGIGKLGRNYCMMGAVEQVAHSDYSRLRPILCAAIGSDSPTRWNDRRERTQAEVLAAFDKAIELAEAGQ